MRKPISAIAYLVATALIVAGAVYGLRAQGSDDGDPGAAATARQVHYMSTDGVIENIERRLTAHEGQQMKAACPKQVPKTIGTTFQCKVYFLGRADSIAAAHVMIDGPRGEFRWKSVAKIKSTPKPVPTSTPTS